ncbi:hypothetical protein V5O48_004439 [Marasmius crinis-equi]|uniref:Uncharacterized protein n=1 Tax=Marasmius crinis-equi TaxID=585013 RepID=A0ABR3FQ22_9AGAR
MSTPAKEYYTSRLKELVQGADVEAIVPKITKPTLDAISRDSESDVEDTLWKLWGAFAEEARRTSDKSAQNKLIDGLKAIQALSPVLVQKNDSKEQYSNWGGRVWDDLPIFGAQVREEWNYNGEGDESRWANINAFVARIVNARLLDFDMYAIWSLREALESSDLSKGDGSLNGLIPAAAQWIFIAGSFIYQSDREWNPPPNQGNPARGGPLIADVKQGFSKERWAFWKKGFETVSKNTGDPVAEKTREMAREAIEKMGEIETESQA